MPKRIVYVSFNLPERAEFSEEYRGGSIVVGVWPSPRVMTSVLDREGALADLEEWEIDNIFLGFLQDGYTDNDLQLRRASALRPGLPPTLDLT